MNEDRKLLLQLIGSLTFCDHMSDVSNDVDFALKRLGVEVPEGSDGEDWGTAERRALHKLGITTLRGTRLGDDDEAA